MTPAEVAAILRQFNEWRRDFDDKIKQPDSRDIGMALDAAVEMIDRLEAAEKEVESIRQGISFRDDVVAALAVERDTLRAKIAEMEQQEPVAVVENDHNADGLSARISEYLPAGMTLYALPGAQTQGE